VARILIIDEAIIGRPPQILRLGAMRTISKPFTLDEMLRAVVAVLGPGGA